MDIDQERAKKIAALNDEYRRGNPAKYIFTREVLAKMNTSRVISMIRSYDVFTEDNDPYGEHDFGRVTLDGETLFWKIDYYDQNLKYGCDPLDVDCKRVLTVMCASEY